MISKLPCLDPFLGLYEEILNEGPNQEKDRVLNVLLMSEEGHYSPDQ